jgi:hypothetical protein
MGSIVAYDPGSFFILRIHKSWVGNPALRWTNTYEMVSTGPGGLPELIAAANKVYTLERACAGYPAFFDSFTIGTWEPDGTPYDPNTFVTYGINTVGQRTFNGDPEPAEMSVFVRKVLQTGRQGRVMWRANLAEGDVNSVGGLPGFANNGYATAFNAAKVSSGIPAMFFGGDDPIHLASLTATGDHWREVMDMTVNSVRNVNMNHRYFDVNSASAAIVMVESGRENIFGEAELMPVSQSDQPYIP